MDDQIVSSTVIIINNDSGRNPVDLVFIQPIYYKNGVGLLFWKAMKQFHLETKV